MSYTPRGVMFMVQLGVSFEPPTSDQHEELVHHGHLDGGHLLSLRDAGVSWSVIRDEAIAKMPTRRRRRDAV